MEQLLLLSKICGVSSGWKELLLEAIACEDEATAAAAVRQRSRVVKETLKINKKKIKINF